MGGFVWANEEAAVNLQVTEGEAQVAALVNRGGGQGELVLQAGYQDVWRQPCELRPGHPVQTEAALPATGADGLTLSVVLEGKPIISYEHPPTYQREPACEMPRPVLRLPDDAGITVEELCQHAVRAEKVGEVERARAQYERALRRDPGFSGAHLGLGVLSHQAGRGDEAPGHLVKAVERDPENDEAWYCLGVALLQGAELQAGQEILGRLVGRTACRVEAALSLARSLVLLQPERALALASQVPDGPTARLVRAQVYRLQRRAWGPEEEGWEKEDPLDAQLAAERYFRAKWLGDDEAAQSAFERLAELCGDDPEAWLEILCEERDLGAVRPLGELLAAVCDRFPAVMASPMVHYCLPTFVMPEQAEEELDLGARGDLANCFPSRFEEWMPLFAACDQRPSDWRPRLLLGNLMAGLGRREEALAAWQDAARLDDSNAVLCRNLALAYRLWHNDLPASLDWYAKAVARRPDEYHLYLEQDQALIASGATPEQRLAALEAGPPEVVNRWETAARRTECLVALQRWDEALELLPAYRFKPWEGARQMHGLWVAALTGRAERHRAAGDLRAAVADYELALTYPRHLGVGCAAYPQEAKLHWMVAETAGELGDEPKRQEHLSAAAEEKHQGLGEADLYKLRALRALDRSAEADELATALKEWAEERLKGRADDQTAQQVLTEL
jgi:tetratricopeptide (TPR) repeat protein